MEDLTAKTEASLRKFKERADQLREDLGDARAATKVQMKAMIQRLDAKHEEAEKRLEELKKSSASGTQESIQELHDEIVDDLQSMLKTIRRRIR